MPPQRTCSIKTPRLPQQYYHNRYAFHCANQTDVESILDAGIEHTRPPGTNTKDAADVIDSLDTDTEFPFDRTQAAYCYITPSYVASLLCDRDRQESLIDDAVLVVDTRRITAPMYLADMSAISDLLDSHYVDASIMLRYDTPTEALTAYRDSIQRVSSPVDITTYHAEVKGGLPELVVDGTIPSDAIIDVI